MRTSITITTITMALAVCAGFTECTIDPCLNSNLLANMTKAQQLACEECGDANGCDGETGGESVGELGYYCYVGLDEVSSQYSVCVDAQDMSEYWLVQWGPDLWEARDTCDDLKIKFGVALDTPVNGTFPDYLYGFARACNDSRQSITEHETTWVDYAPSPGYPWALPQLFGPDTSDAPGDASGVWHTGSGITCNFTDDPDSADENGESYFVPGAPGTSCALQCVSDSECASTVGAVCEDNACKLNGS